IEEMRAAGLENVHREPVKVPHWVRGEESAQLTAPYAFNLHAVALGGSVGTPGQGIVANVVEVSSFEELHALGAGARGKVVLFNKPMNRAQDYGTVVGLRRSGAIEAARAGAIAALLRSVGTGAFRLPHTGAMAYEATVPKIPYAAVAAEDADLMH